MAVRGLLHLAFVTLLVQEMYWEGSGGVSGGLAGNVRGSFGLINCQCWSNLLLECV